MQKYIFKLLIIGMLLCNGMFVLATNSFDVENDIPAKDVPSDKALTIKQSLELAGENMLNMLNPDENYLPNFRTTVRIGSYKSNMAFWWPAHNIGRWWDAVLRMEETFGFKIPQHIEAAMLENTKNFFDNPDCIPLDPNMNPYGLDAVGKKLQWDIHSLREGLLALYSLARWRGNEWAVQTGLKMIDKINDRLLDSGEWNLEKIDAYHTRGPFVIHNLEPCDTHGRLLEALVWFFEQTNEPSVKKLASRIALWHFNNTTQANGAINPKSRADHTHSYLGTLRGLLLYGQLTKQSAYIKRVADAYRVNVPKIMKPSGYTSHNMLVESFGETTSSGDIAQLALWLYSNGYDEFVDDVEKIVRARILPSQIRSTPPLLPQTCARGDICNDMEKRIIGGYGGCTVYPHAGKVSVVDVSAADIHSLVDIYNHIVIDRDGVLEILLHLDMEDGRVRIKTDDNENSRVLQIYSKRNSSFKLRLPKWLNTATLVCDVNGKSFSPIIEGHYASFEGIKQNDMLTISYELPKQVTTEVDLGVEYTLYWRGNTVVGISPNNNFYPFYPDAPKNW